MDKLTRRKTFSKILVAINDSSKAADKAVYYSTRIAEDYDAILVVLYVIQTQTDLDTATIPSHVIDLRSKRKHIFLKYRRKYIINTAMQRIL